MTASQLTLSAPPSFSASPVSLRNNNDRAAGPSDFSEQLRDHLANHEAAEPPLTHPEQTAAEPGKLTSSKQRKISQQDPPESGKETDTAQLSSNAQQVVSDLSSNDGQRGSRPDKHEQQTATKPPENSPLEVSGPANTGNAAAGDLALAMRISSGDGNLCDTESQPSTVKTGLATNVPSASSSGTQLAPPPEAAQPHHQPEAPASIETAALEANAGFPDSAKSAGTKETGKAQPSGFEAELSKALAEPVRAAHVQIASSDNQRIDIRMLERGGALSVTVRSADSGLTKALQEHAPELAGRLSQENFRTELWAPSQAKDQGGHESSGGNPQSRGGETSGQRNPGQQQKQNGKQSQTPEWIENFEQNQTAFQQRIDYTWHQ